MMQTVNERRESLMPESTFPLGLNDCCDRVAELHTNLGKLGYFIPQPELDKQVLGD
jgi:hypothetical protein